MLKIYRMPNGRTYQFDDSKVPAGAVLVEKEAKAEKPKKNKARKPKETK